MSILSNIPGVQIRNGDQFFTTDLSASQKKITILGTAESGESYKLFPVSGIRAAESAFGQEAEVVKALHEVRAAGANNISLMRIGGRQGEVSILDDASGTLDITTTNRDDEILSRYTLAILDDGTGANRYLVYDLDNSVWVFDSAEILVQDFGILILDDSDFGRFDIGDVNDPATNPKLADLLTGSFVWAGAGAPRIVTDVVLTAGTDQATPSLIERYAQLEQAYLQMEYQDTNLLLLPGVYADAANIIDLDSTDFTNFGAFWKGAPRSGDENDVLGYAWQYMYEGRMYVFFTDADDYFATIGTAAVASATINTDLVVTALKAGKGGNACSIETADGGAGAAIAVDITESAYGLDIYVSYDDAAGTVTNADLAAAIIVAAENGGTAGGKPFDELLDVAGITGGATVAAVVAKTFFTGGLGPAAATHDDLTGDACPTSIEAVFDAGQDTELREVDLAHQAGLFCHRASTYWNMPIACINTSKPASFAACRVASHVGEPPTLSVFGSLEGITTPTDNGTGLYENRLLIGLSETSNGYRSAKLTDDGGDSTDGFAYGGYIKTTGDALPVDSDYAYGIDDADEATDFAGAEIDVGKFLWIAVDWPMQVNGFNGGSNIRVQQASINAGILAQLDPQNEPIGEFGRLRRVSDPFRITAAQIAQMAKFRMTGILRENNGLFISKARTAANPQSDYKKLSTVTMAAEIGAQIRSAIRPKIGKAMAPGVITNIESDVSSVMQRLLDDEMINGFSKPSVSISRADRTNGVIKIRMRWTPPFAIESIEFQASMELEPTS